MLRSKLSTLLAASSASALLAACAVGPDAPVPTLPLQGTGAFVGSADPAVTSAFPARDDWWRLYADPTLDGLVAQAFAENNQLESAAANLRAVRASLSEARSARLPSTNTSASVQRSRGSAATSIGLPPGEDAPEITSYDVGLDASYEIDLFGRVGSAIRAARADADAAAEALAGLQVTVAAETARAYADTCSANAQIAVAERSVEIQNETLRLTETLLNAGAGTGLDVASARAAVAQTAATLPTLRAARSEALFRLSTLTGTTPAEASQAAAACGRPPQLTQPIPLGDGAALLARRPDVRQAERNVAAAAARVNVATAN